MSHVFTATFAPRQAVRIVALERPGRVQLVRTDGHEPEYLVVWWDEGKRCIEWLNQDELEAAA